MRFEGAKAGKTRKDGKGRYLVWFTLVTAEGIRLPGCCLSESIPSGDRYVNLPAVFDGYGPDGKVRMKETAFAPEDPSENDEFMKLFRDVAEAALESVS